MKRTIDLLRETSPEFESQLEKALNKTKEQAEQNATGIESASPTLENLFDAIRTDLPRESMGRFDLQARAGTEAIILSELRPAWFIDEDRIIIDKAFDQTNLVTDNIERLEDVAKQVGRVDLFNHATLDYAGTGWLIEKDIVVTNRHVAEVFAHPNGLNGFDFKSGAFGDPVETRLDFIRQRNPEAGARRRADVLEVLFMAPQFGPDIALLRVEVMADADVLELDTNPVKDDRPVGAIGYPAEDRRNDATLMDAIFGAPYGVKRFSPGLVRGTDRATGELLTDYSSLGGNSGSAVVDLESGKVRGLHFAGLFKRSNYAVTAELVDAARREVRSFVPSAGPVVIPTADTPAPEFNARGGYDPEFLGGCDLTVSLPGLEEWQDDLAPLKDQDEHILNYTHFSVIMSASRRLPLLTAVNIDGDKAFRLKRRGRWSTDGRMEKSFQADNTLYKHNPLDRGHMVRRKDPGWGDSREEAQQGEVDTFHYTNCAPQHKDLNQRDWVQLEDYVLEAAVTRDFKTSVFTGPVFQEDDRKLKRQPGAEDIRIPGSFWKIAVMVNADTGKLSASGYILTQGQMIRSITESSFVFGAFKTYQVPIRLIETATKLDFSHLKPFDPLDGSNESLFGDGLLEVSGAGTLKLV